MDEDNDHQTPPNANEHFSWMQQTSWIDIPPEHFPSAPGPLVYEGFVPEQVQQQSTYGPSYHYGPSNNSDPQGSRYPVLDQQIGGPVQPYDDHFDLNFLDTRLRPGLGAANQSIYDHHSTINDDDTSFDEDETQYDSAADTEGDTEHTTNKSGRGKRRGRGRGRHAGAGRGRAKKRERQRGGWNRGTKTGLRPVLDPGDEFNTLHKEATEAFIERQNYDEALELILKAITINPEIYSAHVLLSEIYFARHDDERGVAALFSGAHASPNDPAVWYQLADVCLQRSSLDRFTMLKQASYCFQRLLQIDQQDYDARFQKAAISRELGHHSKALSDFEILLQKMPHNSSVLRQIAEVCLDINDVGRAIGLYDDALEYQRLTGTVDEDTFTWADLIIYVDLIARPNGVFHALQVLKRIARYLLGREDEEYWDQYTTDDCEWDADHAPRRIEVPQFEISRHLLETYGIGLPLELRVKLGDFRLKNGDRTEALRHFEWLVPDDRADGSPLYEYSDLFLQVADALREVKEFEQALRYYEALYSIHACDDVDFWLGLGACSYVCEKKEQALTCYEEAKAADPTSGEARTQLSKLYAERGEREKALLLARSAITIFESQIPRTSRRKYERKDLREARESAQNAYRDAYKLPKPKNKIDKMPRPVFSRRARERARRIAKEVAGAAAEEVAIQPEEQEQQEDIQEAIREPSLTPPSRQEGLQSREKPVKQPKKYKAFRNERQFQKQDDTIRQLYSTLSSVTEAMRNGDDVARNVWMDCAEALIDKYRTQKVFYPAERYIKFRGFDRPHLRPGETQGSNGHEQPQQDVPLPSIESTLPIDYCGITFTNWLDIFLEYAMLLAHNQEDVKDCYAVIEAALDCNVWYHDEQAVFQIYTCWLVCSLALRDENTLFNIVIRWFMREFSLCTDTFRLFGALNYYFPYSNDKGGKNGQMNSAVFRLGANQKYMFRQVVSLDSQLPPEYGSDQPDGAVPDFMRNSNHYTPNIPERHSQGVRLSRSHTQGGGFDLEDSASPASMFSHDDIEQSAQRTFTPKELDIVLLTLYGQILYAGNSFPNALSYFYRAYNVDPKNPVLLLSIALCYIHQMLKRQNENRHMYLLQGWSFFEQYADARIEEAKRKEKEGWFGLVLITKREIEFNRARCWQMLGMNDLAIRSYGKMLDVAVVKSEDDMDVDTTNEYREVYSMEAGYAMMSIYALSGNMAKAREMTEKYLVIE